MKPKRADKILLSSMPVPPGQPAMPATKTAGRTATGSSPYRTPSDTGPRIAPERPPRWRPKHTILQVAAATGRFDTLRQAIDGAGLTGRLAENGPFTLFAPTDRAFAKLPDLRALLDDKERLLRLLSYHVVPSKVRAPRRGAPSSVATLDGKQLEIAVVAEDGGYRVGNARIVKTNMRASNGVIHAIDTILTPR
jgi:uncharacterized surface protein with fasciclin (FAS1) repeats